MAGPAPKKNRQRRDAPKLGDWQTLDPLPEPVLPTLEEIDADVEWPSPTRRLWESWRKSPVTGVWSEDDVSMAIDTINLHRHNPARHASEIRLRMTDLALTMKGRQIARLLLPDESVDTEPTVRRVTPVRERPEAV